MQRRINTDEPREFEDSAPSSVEEQGILEAIKSLNAGEGLPFDEVMRELDVESARAQLIDGLVEAERDVVAGRLISHDKMDALLAAWEQENDLDRNSAG
jgi:hypothetical protein